MNPLAMKTHELDLPNKKRLPSLSPSATTLVSCNKRKIACDTARDPTQCQPPVVACCSQLSALSPNAHKPPSQQQPAPLIGRLTSGGNNSRPAKNATPTSGAVAVANNDLGGFVGCTTTSPAVDRLHVSSRLERERWWSGIDRAGRDGRARSMSLSSLVTHSNWLVNVITRGSDRLHGVRLLVGLCLLAAYALDSIPSVARGQPAATRSPANGIQRTDLPYLDERCNGARPTGASTSEVGQMLLILKCDIKPLFEQFKQIYGQEAAHSIGKGSQLDVGHEYAVMSANIESFANEALEIIGFINFCNLDMVNRLHHLKAKADNSRLLKDIFNVIAIEYHRSCLERTITSLPVVPTLVRDVVQTYIDGADQPLERPEVTGYFAGYRDRKFDVNAAIKRSGPLSVVIGLSLAIGSSARIENFIDSCKSLVLQVDMGWTVLSEMEKMLNDEDNSILRLNNAVLRSLPTTRFADICSQLSASA